MRRRSEAVLGLAHLVVVVIIVVIVLVVVVVVRFACLSRKDVHTRA